MALAGQACSRHRRRTRHRPRRRGRAGRRRRRGDRGRPQRSCRCATRSPPAMPPATWSPTSPTPRGSARRSRAPIDGPRRRSTSWSPMPAAVETGPFAKADPTGFARMSNSTSWARCMQARRCCRGMIERGFGRIVAVASTAGLKGYAYVSRLLRRQARAGRPHPRARGRDRDDAASPSTRSARATPTPIMVRDSIDAHRREDRPRPRRTCWPNTIAATLRSAA